MIKRCECGCGEKVYHKKRFIKNHSANKGISPSANTRIKMSIAKKGKPAVSKGRLGMKNSASWFEKMSGERHPNWKGGISFLPYCLKFNRRLKEAVKERDNHTCQLCGATDNVLTVHHVHYDKENCYPDVITLCRGDNCKVNFNRKHYEELFMNKLNDRELLFWTLSLYKEKTDNDARTEV